MCFCGWIALQLFCVTYITLRVWLLHIFTFTHIYATYTTLLRIYYIVYHMYVCIISWRKFTCKLEQACVQCTIASIAPACSQTCTATAFLVHPTQWQFTKEWSNTGYTTWGPYTVYLTVITTYNFTIHLHAFTYRSARIPMQESLPSNLAKNIK